MCEGKDNANVSPSATSNTLNEGEINENGTRTITELTVASAANQVSTEEDADDNSVTSVSTFGSEFSLDDPGLLDFIKTANGRDSLAAVRDRGIALRRRSRASIKGITSCLDEITEAEEDKSASTLDTDFSLDIQNLANVISTSNGRDSVAVAKERGTAPRRRSRASIKDITICLDEISEAEENPDTSASTLGTDFSLDIHNITNAISTANGRDSMAVARDRNTAPRRQGRASIKGTTIDKGVEGESASTFGSDFNLDERIAFEFGTAFGRDSRVVTRERNGATRRKSRASMKITPIDDVFLEEEEQESVASSKLSGNSSGSTDISLSDTFIQEFKSSLGRDSMSVTRERIEKMNRNRNSQHVTRVEGGGIGK